MQGIRAELTPQPSQHLCPRLHLHLANWATQAAIVLTHTLYPCQQEYTVRCQGRPFTIFERKQGEAAPPPGSPLDCNADGTDVRTPPHPPQSYNPNLYSPPRICIPKPPPCMLGPYNQPSPPALQ